MLGGQRRYNSISHSSVNKQMKIKSNKNQTYEEAKTKLMNETRPKNGRKLTLEESIANSCKVQEFNNRWKKKKTEQTLQEALFDVYVERNLRNME